MTERAPFRLLKRAARFRAARFVFISIFVRDCSAAHYSLNNCHVERRAEGPASQVGGTSIIAIRTGFCSSDPRDPRFRSASLGVTAFAVMLSGGAASPAVETSRPIGTFTHHEPYTQCVASDGWSFMQLFARGGCGLPAQSVESTGCHLERNVADAKSKGLDMEKHSPLRFARGHADPAVEIPRLRSG